VLSNLTDKGAETIVDKPKRIKEVNGKTQQNRGQSQRAICIIW